jgi:hypothetical protein
VSATGDEVYGNSPHLRLGLYDARLPFVLACVCSDPLIEAARADELAVSIPTRNWQVHAVGKGGTARVWLGWLETAVAEHAAGHHYLLVRQNLWTGEQAFYRCWSPDPRSLRDLVTLAGARWAMFECAEDLTGTGLVSFGVPGHGDENDRVLEHLEVVVSDIRDGDEVEGACRGGFAVRG